MAVAGKGGRWRSFQRFAHDSQRFVGLDPIAVLTGQFRKPRLSAATALPEGRESLELGFCRRRGTS